MLWRAQWIAENYAGKIVAVGRVASLPYKAVAGISGLHFMSPIFADIDRVELLERPVDMSEFSAFQSIAKGVTVTPVLGRSFQKVREVLSIGNDLPSYVLKASPVPGAFRDAVRYSKATGVPALSVALLVSNTGRLRHFSRWRGE